MFFSHDHRITQLFFCLITFRLAFWLVFCGFHQTEKISSGSFGWLPAGSFRVSGWDSEGPSRHPDEIQVACPVAAGPELANYDCFGRRNPNENEPTYQYVCIIITMSASLHGHYTKWDINARTTICRGMFAMSTILSLLVVVLARPTPSHHTRIYSLIDCSVLAQQRSAVRDASSQTCTCINSCSFRSSSVDFFVFSFLFWIVKYLLVSFCSLFLFHCLCLHCVWVCIGNQIASCVLTTTLNGYR